MKNNNYFFLISIIVSLYLFQCTLLIAQNADEEVRAAIEKIDKGQADQIKKQLPELVSKYQNTAGIMYLQGRLSSDGIEAVKFYQGVVDNFPKSEWADDALYRIYQYYYSLGLYRTADLKIQQLRKEYPRSEYLTGKPETKQSEGEEKPVKLPQKEIVTTDSQEIQKPSKVVDQASTSTSLEPYTVQVGAFSGIAGAEKQKKLFDDLGYRVEITNKIRNGRSMYLVWIGSFKTLEDARAMVKEIKKKYKIDSLIIERY